MAPQNRVLLAASAAGTVTTTIYIPGFQTYMASGYAPSPRNVERLAALNAAPASLRLIGFDAAMNNKNMLVCRASYPVYGPNKTPFATLLEAASNMELAEAGLAAADAPRVHATLDEFDFASFGVGKWMISATFVVDGKAPLVVKNEYSYPVSGGAVAGCADVTKALAAGVESFLNKLYSDPRFGELFAQ